MLPKVDPPQVKSPFPCEPDAQGLRRLDTALASLKAGAQANSTREGAQSAARRKPPGRPTKGAQLAQAVAALEEISALDECICFPNLVAIS